MVEEYQADIDEQDEIEDSPRRGGFFREAMLTGLVGILAVGAYVGISNSENDSNQESKPKITQVDSEGLDQEQATPYKAQITYVDGQSMMKITLDEGVQIDLNELYGHSNTGAGSGTYTTAWSESKNFIFNDKTKLNKDGSPQSFMFVIEQDNVILPGNPALIWPIERFFNYLSDSLVIDGERYQTTQRYELNHSMPTIQQLDEMVTIMFGSMENFRAQIDTDRFDQALLNSLVSLHEKWVESNGNWEVLEGQMNGLIVGQNMEYSADEDGRVQLKLNIEFRGKIKRFPVTVELNQDELLALQNLFDEWGKGYETVPHFQSDSVSAMDAFGDSLEYDDVVPENPNAKMVGEVEDNSEAQLGFDDQEPIDTEELEENLSWALGGVALTLFALLMFNWRTKRGGPLSSR